MKDLIHLTDSQTGEVKTHYVVSRNWLVWITGMVIFTMACTFGIVILGVTNRLLIIKNQEATLKLQEYDAIQKQRNQAFDDMLLNRAVPQVFAYNKACQYAKEKGEACLDNPTWWADPNKYPLLKDDPSGTGLFPNPKQGIK